MDMRESLYTVGKDKVQLANPLVQDGQKPIPSVRRVFSKGREMSVYLQTYQQAITQPHPLVAFVSLYQNQVKAFETKPVEVEDCPLSITLWSVGLDTNGKEHPHGW